MAQDLRKPTIRLSEKSILKLKVIAVKNCRNLNSEVRMVLGNHIENYEKQHGIIKAKDYQNLFLSAESVEEFDVIRNGSPSHSIEASRSSNKTLNLFLDTDIEVGDILVCKNSQRKFEVKKLELKMIDREKICITVVCT